MTLTPPTGDMMMTTEPRLVRLETRDHRFIEFNGEELARASSDDGKVQRWTEFTLYRTVEPTRYVLERVGRSVVYHAAGSTCSREAAPTTAGVLRDRAVGFLGCLTCQPVDYESPAVAEDADLLVERDRHHAIVCDTPEAVVSALHNRDPETHQLFLTNVACDLLDHASDRDEAIGEAYRVQRI